MVKNGSSCGQKQGLCKACESSVSLRYDTAYYDLEADPAIFDMAVRALAEGNSLRTTARIVQTAVYQGKLSEGADFQSNLLKSVICVSIPMEYPSLFHQRLEAKYTAHFAEIAEDLGDDVQAKSRECALDRLSLSWVLQACGRGIRSESDRSAFVLLDKRYHDYD